MYRSNVYLKTPPGEPVANKLQKRDALQCLKEYEKKFRWSSYERVLDIGCGDGGVTTEILRRFIPGDFETLTGCDISEKMVQYANEHHGDARIKFVVLDIAGTLPPHFRGSFEHAYSFYTLHWIHDQEWHENTPSAGVRVACRNRYKRATMRCAGDTYKCLRPPREQRLPAETASRTLTLRPRQHTRNSNKNHKKILTIKTKNSNTIKHKNQLDMNDAELYQQSNKLQKRDALQCLKEYEKKFRWSSYERVLDIGCGDGGVTTEILRRFIPGDFETLTGCDISEKMVQYANEHHGDARIKFVVLDIAGTLPPHFRGSFEHAYSFYTLHWIHDQERAFNNIYDLLSENGECLLIFLGHMPLFDVFRTLARRPKWREWLKDVDRFVSPYHDSQDPEKDIKRLMAKTGFKNIDVQIKEKSFIYNSLQDCKNAVAAVNPFKMPVSVEEEFLDDYLQQVRDMRLIDQVNNNLEETVHINMNYTLIVTYATKNQRIQAENVNA